MTFTLCSRQISLANPTGGLAELIAFPDSFPIASFENVAPEIGAAFSCLENRCV